MQYLKLLPLILLSSSLFALQSPPAQDCQVPASLSTPFLLAQDQKVAVSAKERQLIQHVQTSINRSNAGDSLLTDEILALSGMSSPKVRHLLNNLAGRTGTHYLEIGLWAGSTFVSALYLNGDTTEGIGLDNWSQFGGPFQECLNRCKRFLDSDSYSIHSVDCFAISPAKCITKPINLYFYDGDHSADSQCRAFTHFNGVLDNLFVAIVDDWNWEDVRKGTQAAFSQLGYQVLYEVALPSRGNGDTEQWWNGLYVAVIRK